MRKIIFAFLIFCSSCMAPGEKCTIQFTDGTLKTVYGVQKDGSFVIYFNSQKDAEDQKNKITIPMTIIKSITETDE